MYRWSPPGSRDAKRLEFFQPVQRIVLAAQDLHAPFTTSSTRLDWALGLPLARHPINPEPSECIGCTRHASESHSASRSVPSPSTPSPEPSQAQTPDSLGGTRNVGLKVHNTQRIMASSTLEVNTYKHTSSHPCMDAYIYMHMHACVCTYIHTYIHTDRQTDRQTDVQTSRRTEIQTYRQTVRKYTGTDRAPNYPKVDPCTSSLNLVAKSALKFTGAFLHSGQSSLEPPKWQVRGENKTCEFHTPPRD